MRGEPEYMEAVSVCYRDLQTRWNDGAMLMAVQFRQQW
jgi:hypothetical protein